MMRISRVVGVSSLLLTAISLFAQGTSSSVEANKKLVYEFYRIAFEPMNADAVPQFCADSYIEHNPTIGNGTREDLMNVMKSGRFGKGSGKVVNKLNDPPAMIAADGEI